MNHDAVSFDTRPTRRSRLPLAALIGLVAFVLGIVATYWFLGPAVDRMMGRRDTTASPAVAAQPLAMPAPGTDIASLQAREIMLAARIEGLENRLANIDMDSRVASTFATRAEALLVAFAARRALDRGLPLGYIEGQLRERFGGIQPRAVNYLIGAARAPVTLEDLRLAMDTLAPDLVSGGAQEGWWAGLRREVSSLVVLREDGTASGRPNDRLIRARRMLDAGHLEGALAEVARMPGAAQAQSWVEAARRYITARRALNIIEAAAIEGVQPPAPAPTTIPTLQITPTTARPEPQPPVAARPAN
jgi:hypothetical protein